MYITSSKRRHSSLINGRRILEETAKNNMNEFGAGKIDRERQNSLSDAIGGLSLSRRRQVEREEERKLATEMINESLSTALAKITFKSIPLHQEFLNENENVIFANTKGFYKGILDENLISHERFSLNESALVRAMTRGLILGELNEEQLETLYEESAKAIKEKTKDALKEEVKAAKKRKERDDELKEISKPKDDDKDKKDKDEDKDSKGKDEEKPEEGAEGGEEPSDMDVEGTSELDAKSDEGSSDDKDEEKEDSKSDDKKSDDKEEDLDAMDLDDDKDSKKEDKDDKKDDKEDDDAGDADLEAEAELNEKPEDDDKKEDKKESKKEDKEESSKDDDKEEDSEDEDSEKEDSEKDDEDSDSKEDKDSEEKEDDDKSSDDDKKEDKKSDKKEEESLKESYSVPLDVFPTLVSPLSKFGMKRTLLGTLMCQCAEQYVVHNEAYTMKRDDCMNILEEATINYTIIETLNTLGLMSPLSTYELLTK